MPAVTVGLPFFDNRSSLADAIRSVFAQTFTDWELLLVDDGGGDGARDVAERVRNPRVRVFSDGERRRLPARLNQLVDLAGADLIARIDADDMMHPDRLTRQLRVLKESPLVDVVGSAMFNLNRRGEPTTVAVADAARPTPFHVLRRDLIIHPTMVARRSWLRDHPYDVRYPRAEDRELFARTCRGLRFVNLPEPLYLQGHRKDEGRMLRDYIASTRDNRRIFRDHAGRLVGPLAVVPLCVESLAKEGVFRTLTALGQQDLLVSRRGRVATAAERAEGEAALRRIRETRVPGLDD